MRKLKTERQTKNLGVMAVLLVIPAWLGVPGTASAGVISSYDIQITLPNLNSIYNATLDFPSGLVNGPVTVNSLATISTTSTPGTYTFSMTPLACPIFNDIGVFSPSYYSTFTVSQQYSSIPYSTGSGAYYQFTDPVYADLASGHNYQFEWSLPTADLTHFQTGTFSYPLGSGIPTFDIFSYNYQSPADIEYATSMKITPVPIPPAWLMMLTGLGLLIPLYRGHRLMKA